MANLTIEFESAAISDRGLSEKRPQNEDAFVEMPAIGLFAVADGVGGAQAGDVASQMAMEILSEAFSNLHIGGDAEERMKAAIRRANEAIFQMSSEIPQLASMATTIAAVHIKDNIVTIGHVGDSRVYRIDPRGHLFRETQDHSVVEAEVRAGRMTAAQASRHPSRNVINRALGVDASVEVDLKTIMVEPNTTFLICSDGITRHIDDIELREMLSEKKAPREICKEMRHICYSRGAEDNLTAVIVRVADSEEFAQEESTIASKRAPIATSRAAFGVRETRRTFQKESFVTDNAELLEPFDDHDSELEKLGPRPASKPVDEEDYSSFFSDNREREKPKSAGLESSQLSENRSFIVEGTKKRAGILTNILASLGLLVVGSAIGAGAYYFFTKPQPETPVPTAVEQQPLANMSFSKFEAIRREVDQNPEMYLKTNESRAEDAEDYYLLGRASLLLSKYTEAKGFFVKANSRLPKAEEANRAILRTEIALGLSVVDNPFSKKTFEDAMGIKRTTGQNLANAGKNAGNSNSSNSNTNSANSSPRPR